MALFDRFRKRATTVDINTVNDVLLRAIMNGDAIKRQDALTLPAVSGAVDFISGTIYALGGSMKKIGRSILVCAPRNVDIDAGVSIYNEKGEQPWKK